jgi:hypothetical protein
MTLFQIQRLFGIVPEGDMEECVRQWSWPVIDQQYQKSNIHSSVHPNIFL